MFRVKESASGKAFTAIACLDVKASRMREMSRPHFLQNEDALEFCVLEFGHLCFRFFFSNVNVTVSRPSSTLKFSSGI
jgi:hypothetical protein